MNFVFADKIRTHDKSLLQWEMRREIFFPLKMATVLILGAVSPVLAGQTVVSGGGTVRQEYDSNIYRSNIDRVSEWTTAFSPTMSIVAKGQQHALSFRYAPSAIYSHRTDEERWDHLLAASLHKQFSERLSFYVRDTFVRAEDPYTDDEAGIELADSRGRNRYRTNNVSVGFGYDYAKESFIRLSYMNMVLDNEDRTIDDYDKHIPGASIAHRFGQHWQVQADYSFTKGNFEQEDDLENHAGDVYISYHPSSASKIFTHGGYTANRYEGLQEDYDLHRVSLGYENQVSATFDVLLQGGAVYLIRDVQEDKDTFYYLMTINRKLQHGAMSLAGEGGIDENQFDSTSEGAVSRYWQLQADFHYYLDQNLFTSFKWSFREDKYWERIPEEKEEELQAQASLSYTFGQWYTASVRYVFSRKEADREVRSYDDNRVFLELGFNKDFFRW